MKTAVKLVEVENEKVKTVVETVLKRESGTEISERMLKHYRPAEIILRSKYRKF